MRCGMVGQKLGMMRLFTDDGQHIPVTVVKIDNCQVVAQKTAARDGYTALQVGVGSRKVKNIARAQREMFAKAKIEPKQKLMEFRVDEDQLIDIGAELTVDHFVADQFVDVTAISQGKGFAGGMKRHGFGGLRASHGVSISHRSHGSTGQCQDPGKVFKGKKMAGHMGATQVTTLNLKVVKTDAKRGVVMIKGAVPGPKGGWVRIRDAVKKTLPDDAPRPGAIRNGTAAETEQNAAEE